MTKNLSKFLIPLFLALWTYSDNPALAQRKTVIINEIAWMGTKTSYNDEWIELYNPTLSPIVLEGWMLKSKEGKPEIKLSGTIGPNSYFLLERTNDATILEINADQIYAGGLNNGGEHLFLLDNSGRVADEVNCTLGWFAGNNETKKTMERINPLTLGSDPNNWKTSQKAGGTPRAKNSPQEKIKKEKELETISSVSSSSSFSFVLSIGSTISLFFSMLILALWLKTKKKRDKITEKKSIFRH